MPPAAARPPLRAAILDHLRREGSDSISGIARALRDRDSEAPVHRLTIAGYLAALADQGVLREVDRPPSKHYQLADPDQVMSLHQRVGRAIAELDLPNPERPTAVVAVLHHILGRPLFAAELRHAGYPRTGPGLDTVDATEEDRREYRALFRRRHGLALDIPHGDPLLVPRSGAVRAGVVQEVMRRVLLLGLPGARDLATERTVAERATQSRLAVDSGEGAP